jgi:RHS repeat-associated protein
MVKSVVNGVTTYYVGGIYEKEVDGGTTTERKYYSAGSKRIAMRVNGTLTWLLGDHLGSTSVTAQADGTFQSEMRYTAFGETRSSSGPTPTDYQYTGQRHEAEFGLYFYKARWYDPASAHFTQADTLIPEPGNPMALDRYAYVMNNPLKYTDPTGHSPKQIPPCPTCDLTSWIYVLIKINKIMNSPPIKKGRVLGPKSPGDVTSWTASLLNTNASSQFTEKMKENNNTFDPRGKAQALETWVSLVRGGAIWDFKQDIKQSEAIIPGTENIKLGEHEFNYQALSNIHYGYIGAAAGFSSNLLQAGAGFFQDENTLGPWITFSDGPRIVFRDDPFDNYWVRFGLYLFTEYGNNELTEEEFMQGLDEFIDEHGDPGIPIE